MPESQLINYMYGFLEDTMYLAGIPLLIATAISLVVSILQAMMQIQDQNLSQTIKIVVIVAVFVVAGQTLIQPIFLRTEKLFTDIDRF